MQSQRDSASSHPNRKIPISVAAVVADILAPRYTHNRIDHFMERAGIEGEIPPGMNKVDKTRAWLKVANDKCKDPLAALGTVLVELMEVDTSGYGVYTDLSGRSRENSQRARGSWTELLQGRDSSQLLARPL